MVEPTNDEHAAGGEDEDEDKGIGMRLMAAPRADGMPLGPCLVHSADTHHTNSANASAVANASHVHSVSPGAWIGGVAHGGLCMHCTRWRWWVWWGVGGGRSDRSRGAGVDKRNVAGWSGSSGVYAGAAVIGARARKLWSTTTW